jgi:hypothetical protein
VPELVRSNHGSKIRKLKKFYNDPPSLAEMQQAIIKDSTRNTFAVLYFKTKLTKSTKAFPVS